MQPAVFERTSYYTSLFQKVKPFFHIFVRFLCGEGSPSAGAARTAGAGGSPCLLPPQAARPQVSGDEHGAPEYQQKQNQQKQNKQNQNQDQNQQEQQNQNRR